MRRAWRSRCASAAPAPLLAAAAWAATPALLELGGHAVEGMLLVQSHNPQDSSPRFAAFQQAFRARFDGLPGYGAAVAYDAVLVLEQALARAAPGESLKEAVLGHGPYQGLQQSIAFDRFGDASRTAYATVVRGGRFVLWP
ncbi:MAG: ABC transporter substrate-binding protein [Pseudorhodoferax sp.]